MQCWIHKFLVPRAIWVTGRWCETFINVPITPHIVRQCFEIPECHDRLLKTWEQRLDPLRNQRKQNQFLVPRALRFTGRWCETWRWQTSENHGRAASRFKAWVEVVDTVHCTECTPKLRSINVHQPHSVVV